MTDEEDVCSECYRGWGDKKRSGPHQENLGGPNGCEQNTTPFSRVIAAADQMAEAIKTKLNEDYRGNAPNEPGLRAALSNYLKVKESK